jgi:hypothetical protein
MSRFVRVRIISKTHYRSDPKFPGLTSIEPETRVVVIDSDGDEHEIEELAEVQWSHVDGELPVAIITVRAPDVVIEQDAEVITPAERRGRRTSPSPPPEPWRGHLGDPIPPTEFADYLGKTGRPELSSSPTTVIDPAELPDPEEARRTDRVSGAIANLVAIGQELDGKPVEYIDPDGGPESVRGVVAGVRRAAGTLIPEVRVLAGEGIDQRQSWIPLAMVRVWDESRKSYIPPPQMDHWKDVTNEREPE